jgi:hypothetical protein
MAEQCRLTKTGLMCGINKQDTVVKLGVLSEHLGFMKGDHLKGEVLQGDRLNCLDGDTPSVKRYGLFNGYGIERLPKDVNIGKGRNVSLVKSKLVHYY